MRLRTVVVLLAVVVALVGAGAVALWTGGAGGGRLAELWISDTARDDEFNHHGIGAGDGVVVAPVTARPGAEGLTRRSCSYVRLGARDGSVQWWRGVPPEQCFRHALTKPEVVDLDGDGSVEVVAGTIEEETVVLDAADGTEQVAIPTSTYSYAKPTVADVDSDDALEIVASDISGNLTVADADGTVRWRGNLSGAVYDSPLVVDVDGDRSTEIVVGSTREVVAYERDGTVLWRRPVSGTDVEAVVPVERDDAASDGTRLVAVGFDGVVALDGESGVREWNRSAPGSAALEAVADGDDDGVPEAYVSVAGNRVRALAVTDGSRDWETRLATGDDVTPATVLADLDGDGEPRLVAATNGGTVVVLDPATGSEGAAYRRDVPVWTEVTTADLTDSPGAEVLVRYGDGRVVALAYEE